MLTAADYRFETLVDLVRQRAAGEGYRIMYRFLEEGDVDGPIRELSFRDLDIQSRAIASRLQAVGGMGERALLLFPQSMDFVTSFFGSLFAGWVAVPAYPPEPSRLDRTLPRLRAIARDCGAKVVLTTSSIASLAESLSEVAPDLAQLQWIAIDTILDSDAEAWKQPEIRGRSLAFLQYTSGSTGTPKGVMLTHGNLLANEEMVRVGFGHDERSSFVGWTPLFHDMGLIGNLLQPLYLGSECTLMSPIAFLQKPVRWLQAISRYKAHTSGGPNFAFELCTRKATEDEIDRLELSSWQVAYNGAEPIREDSLRRFTDRFARCGFRREFIYPCYGLAEAALFVTGREKLSGWSSATLNATALEKGQVELSDVGHTHVGVGRGWLDQEIAIVHPDTYLQTSASEVGEVWIRGSNVAQGYWNNTAETQAAFGAHLADTGAGPWLRTGDLGFLRDGELYVAGRLKDLLIIRGRNHYPQDLERTIERASNAVKPGCVAAFSVQAAGEEGLAVVAEIDARRTDVALDVVLAAVREAILVEHDVRPERVVLIPAGRIPKTSSGKIQRRACRAELLAGKLDVLASWPEIAPPTPVAEKASMYERLDSIASRIDDRSTKYRYDLEALPWDQVDAPGDLLPPRLATQMFGREVVETLRADPQHWQTFQWVTGLGLCDLFIEFEEMAVRFVDGERPALGQRRSLSLLVEEEAKHIEMFRRYRDVLRRQHPEWVAAYDRHYAPVIEDVRKLDDRSQYSTDLEYHFALWVKVLFFEEYTVWLHERLRAESATVQPAWYEVHAAHAREEAQHVVTDQAWLKALSIDDVQREAWSKRLLGMLMRTFGLPITAEFALCAELVPALQQVAAQQRTHRPLLVSLFAEKAFRRSAELVPHFGRIARDVRTTEAHAVVFHDGASRKATSEQIASWIGEWLGKNILAAGSFDRSTTFARIGLDSVGAVSLSGDLGSWLGCRLSATVTYDYPTIEMLSNQLASSLQSEVVSATSSIAASTTPSSARQRRLWTVDQARPGEVLDHVTTVYELVGRLDVGSFAEAIQALVARHPTLRTSFHGVGDDVEQVVASEPAVELRVIPARTEALLETARRRAVEMEHTPYDLSKAPLLRVELLRGAPDRHVLVMGLHHIATDGLSMAIIPTDLFALYEAAVSVKAHSLPTLKIAPVDVAREERTLLDSAEGSRRLVFWRERLAGHPQIARTENARNFRGLVLNRTLPSEVFARCQAYAARHDVSLFTTITAALKLALSRRSGSQDVLLSTHLFDRPSADRKALVGYFVNVLTLRTDLSGTHSLSDVMERVRRTWLDALAHELPIDHIVRELWPERYTERWMPSPVAFNMLPWEYGRLGSDTLRIERLVEALPVPGFLFFDQMLFAQPAGDSLSLSLWHNLDAAPEADGIGLLDEVSRILESASDP